jgi:hypothetical protein
MSSLTAHWLKNTEYSILFFLTCKHGPVGLLIESGRNYCRRGIDGRGGCSGGMGKRDVGHKRRKIAVRVEYL